MVIWLPVMMEMLVLNGIYQVLTSESVNSKINVIFEESSAHHPCRMSLMHTGYLLHILMRPVNAALLFATAECFDNPPAHIP